MDLSRCVIGSTGWQPAGMGRKSAPAGIPVIISLVATPDRGIAQAEAAGLTRVGLARGDSFRIYTYPERILGIHSSSKELNDTQDYFPENRIVKMYMQKGRD